MKHNVMIFAGHFKDKRQIRIPNFLSLLYMYSICIYHPRCVRPAAFIKSHQGTNKSVCTLIKQGRKPRKKDNNSLMVCHELESACVYTIKLIPPSRLLKLLHK